VTDQVSHPYKTAGRLIVLCFVVLTFLIESGKKVDCVMRCSNHFPYINVRHRKLDEDVDWIRLAKFRDCVNTAMNVWVEQNSRDSMITNC
jgi:hypothetical protein